MDRPRGLKPFSLGMMLCAAAFGLVAGPIRAEPGAADSPKAAPLSQAQQEQLKERNRLYDETQKLRTEGKLAEAVAAGEKALAIQREVFGNDNEDTATILDTLAAMDVEREDFEAARKIRQEVVAIKAKLLGGGHWEVTDARLALANV